MVSYQQWLAANEQLVNESSDSDYEGLPARDVTDARLRKVVSFLGCPEARGHFLFQCCAQMGLCTAKVSF